MKKLFLIFTFLIAYLFTTTAVHASVNNLHTITLEKSDSGYNVILGTDKVAKVVKKTPSDNELILELNGLTSTETVNAIYKGSNTIDGLVIENSAPNRLKLYITASGIKNSTIMMEPINGVPAIVGETLPVDKLLWVIFGVALLCVIFKISKDITEEDDKPLSRKDIKDREIEMYRRYRADFVSSPMSLDNDYRMKKIMKKIDRKIDERLTASVK